MIPGISESDAITNGTLTDTEKEIYRAVFYSRTATVTMINECESVKANAKKSSGYGRSAGSNAAVYFGQFRRDRIR